MQMHGGIGVTDDVNIDSTLSEREYATSFRGLQLSPRSLRQIKPILVF